ncbi:carboxylate--amine ligase [Nitrososphaera sp.]|uniref:carboxylate--amine ligase n=1 Tax=Nitrososphaera sp. TaxID=1971748 RepID=UPI003181291B
MKRIMVTGSGGTPSTNFVRSLREAGEPFYLIGTDADKFSLMRSETDEKHLVPLANDPDYIDIINDVITETRAEFVHAQPDQEVGVLSKNRNSLKAMTFLPAERTVEVLQDKWLSYQAWKSKGIKVPETVILNNENDLRRAFDSLGGNLWIREIAGAFGKGSIPTTSFELARSWIDFKGGWGKFTAAEKLTPNSVTWLSIWKNGELVVAQSRKRLYWELGNRSPSGVTGVTGTGVTVDDETITKIAMDSIYAVDQSPTGIFGVDLTYDAEGVPNPTEINIGRFFTTHLFFTKAGLNMPYIYVRLAYNESIPSIPKKINPLPPNLCWIRGMDFNPVLTTLDLVEEEDARLVKRRLRLKETRQ